VPIILKSGSLKLLEPPGSLQACNGIALALHDLSMGSILIRLRARCSGGLSYNAVQTTSDSPPSLLFNGYQNTSLGVKWPEYEADYSPSSTAQVMTEYFSGVKWPECEADQSHPNTAQVMKIFHRGKVAGV